ncbi:hypothetical protein [Paenibacillus crassostreae]|uniref:hypothetical protein n=1 Tax=Paenibacillus crassostreae TaxID=1763538 RepID=UPI0008DB8D98|nr:hypothetical protein [Paenibacillus crassostreae]AOZ90751.1 hypothetical protein LPB68_00010 [Paenibacillus crassostreae]
MVQNLDVIESSNPMLQTLWDNHQISNIQIIADETVGVEERAGYYDQAGALRDMFSEPHASTLDDDCYTSIE